MLSGATVDGDIEKTNFGNLFNAVGLVVWILWWFAVSISTLVIGVLLLALAPRVVQSALEVARTRVGPIISWGFVMTLALPIVSFILVLSLIGSPLGLVGLFGVVPLFALGYVMGQYCLGRMIIREPKSPYVAFLAGWAILRVVELVPFFGAVVTFGTATTSAAALCLTSPLSSVDLSAVGPDPVAYPLAGRVGIGRRSGLTGGRRYWGGRRWSRGGDRGAARGLGAAQPLGGH